MNRCECDKSEYKELCSFCEKLINKKMNFQLVEIRDKSLKFYHYKLNLILISVVLLSLIVCTGSVILVNYNTPNKFIERIIEAVERKDTNYLMKNITTEESDWTIEPYMFNSLYKLNDNQKTKLFNTILENFADPIRNLNLTNYDEFVKKNDNFKGSFTLKSVPKLFGLYHQYYLEVMPVYYKVENDADYPVEVNLDENEKVHVKPNSNEVKMLFPGKYNISYHALSNYSFKEATKNITLLHYNILSESKEEHKEHEYISDCEFLIYDTLPFGSHSMTFETNRPGKLFIEDYNTGYILDSKLYLTGLREYSGYYLKNVDSPYTQSEITLHEEDSIIISIGGSEDKSEWASLISSGHGEVKSELTSNIVFDDNDYYNHEDITNYFKKYLTFFLHGVFYANTKRDTEYLNMGDTLRIKLEQDNIEYSSDVQQHQVKIAQPLLDYLTNEIDYNNALSSVYNYKMFFGDNDEMKLIDKQNSEQTEIFEYTFGWRFLRQEKRFEEYNGMFEPIKDYRYSIKFKYNTETKTVLIEELKKIEE